MGIHYNKGNDLLDYLKPESRFAYADGYLEIPQKPGLGIDVDEDKVKHMSEIGHSWRAPVWRHEDGSIAEW